MTEERWRDVTDRVHQLAEQFQIAVPTVKSVQGKRCYYDGESATIHIATYVWDEFVLPVVLHEFAHHVCWSRRAELRHTAHFWQTLVLVLTASLGGPAAYPWREVEYKAGIKYAEKQGWLSPTHAGVSVLAAAVRTDNSKKSGV